MPLDEPTRASLASHDSAARDHAVQALISRAQPLHRHDAELLELLTEAVGVLEAVPDWPEVLTVTNAALGLNVPEEKFVEWLARKAWCLFWDNRPNEAQEVLAEARLHGEEFAAPAMKRRLHLVAGYVMDVRGAHPQALAWYMKALAVSDEDSRSAVLLEIGTSYSKQGRLAEAIAAFDEALSLLRSGHAKHERLRIHLLSRSAVAEESLNDFAEALRRHDTAIAAARVLQNPQLEFETTSRRARALLAVRDFDGALRDLTVAESIAPLARRGVLHVAHDWARFHRARGDWRNALARYRDCVAALPDADEIVSTYSDIWGEILDGVLACLRMLNAPGIDLALNAQRDLAALGRRSDIYGGQPVTAEEQRLTTIASTTRVRDMLLAESSTTFVSAGYRFDLTEGVATRIIAPDEHQKIDEIERLLLRFLFEAPTHSATVGMIRGHFKKMGKPSPQPEALRQIVSRLKKKLGLGSRELLHGKRGTTGGGYALLVD